jgi:hypothetical protein
VAAQLAAPPSYAVCFENAARVHQVCARAHALSSLKCHGRWRPSYPIAAMTHQLPPSSWGWRLDFCCPPFFFFFAKFRVHRFTTTQYNTSKHGRTGQPAFRVCAISRACVFCAQGLGRAADSSGEQATPKEALPIHGSQHPARPRHVFLLGVHALLPILPERDCGTVIPPTQFPRLGLGWSSALVNPPASQIYVLTLPVGAGPRVYSTRLFDSAVRPSALCDSREGLAQHQV